MRVYERALYLLSMMIIVMEGCFQAYDWWEWDDEELFEAHDNADVSDRRWL